VELCVDIGMQGVSLIGVDAKVVTEEEATCFLRQKGSLEVTEGGDDDELMYGDLNLDFQAWAVSVKADCKDPSSTLSL